MRGVFGEVPYNATAQTALHSTIAGSGGVNAPPENALAGFSYRLVRQQLRAKMRITTLYRCLLTLPLLVPGLLLPLRQFQLSPQWLDVFISVGFLSLLVGGIPYALLAAGLLWWMHRKTERQIRVAMFIAPVLMVPLIGLMIVSVVALEGAPFDSDILTAWMVYSGYALAVGYFYVALACLVVWLAKRTGRVGYDGGTLLPNHRMQATAGGQGRDGSHAGCTPAAPDADR